MQRTRITIVILITAITIIGSMSIVGTVTAQETENSIKQSGVTTDGSVITINLAGDASSAAVEGLPDGASVSNLSGVGQSQPGGAIWNNPPGDTVSFVLTPPGNVSVGDSITLDVYDGRTTTTVMLSIIQQSPVLQQETVSLGGSEVRINVSEGAESIAVQGLPDGTSVSELSDGGQSQPDGAIWTNPQGDTVNFTLTPPSGVSVGETITFEVFDGDTTTAVSLDVTEGVPVPESFPTDRAQFRTLAGANGEIGPINIAQAISKNSDMGSVDGVEFSPIDFARIITWNAGQPSATDG